MLIGAIAALGLMTLLLAHLPPDWRVESAARLSDATGVNASPGWLLSRGVTRDASDRVPVISFAARGVEHFSFVSRQFQLPASGALGARRPDFVRVRVQIRGEALTGEAPHWPRAGVMVHNVDRRGKRLWYWPYTAVGTDGNHAWRQLDGLMPVASSAAELRVLAYVLADDGIGQMRGLTVESAMERPLFALTRVLLWTGWVLLALAAMRYALRFRARLYAGLIVLSLGFVITLAGVTPQPLMAEMVKSISFSTQDLLADAGDQLSELRHTAPGTSPFGEAEPQASDPSERDARPASSHLGPDGIAAHQSVDEETDGASKYEERGTPAARTAARPPRTYWVPAFSLIDKVGHLGAFMLLTLLGAYAWPTLAWWRLAGCMIALSGSIQLVQFQLVTREADLLDFAADSLGVCVGALCRSAALALRRRDTPTPA